MLEPLAEEIVAIKQRDEAENMLRNVAEEGGGLTSQATIQYKLDKRTLGTIHLNAITRIYGDHGLEVRVRVCMCARVSAASLLAWSDSGLTARVDALA